MSEETEIVVPTVGMGVTEHVGSDSYAGTITRVHPNGKMFWFKHDTDTLVEGSGMSEHQVYEYTPNEYAHEQCAKLSRKRYNIGKNRFYSGTRFISLDVRRTYRDPSF
jgi:hypothetical protein